METLWPCFVQLQTIRSQHFCPCYDSIAIVLCANFVAITLLETNLNCDGTSVDEMVSLLHGDVIKWKHFQRYWPFVRGIHWGPVNSPHKGQWREALMLSLICAWIDGSVNNREAGDLRRHRAHYDVAVMCTVLWDLRTSEGTVLTAFGSIFHMGSAH